MPCAASPPTAFCQEKVATSSFDQSSACANTAEVASHIVSPSRSAGMKSAEGTRTPDVVPFQMKTTSREKIDGGEVGQLAVGRHVRTRIGDLQLAQDVGDPVLAEGFPGDDVDAALAEQAPQRHFDGAGVGAGRDRDQMGLGDPQNLAGQRKRLAQLGEAGRRAMRATEQGVVQGFGGPAGALGAGAGGEMRGVPAARPVVRSSS